MSSPNDAPFDAVIDEIMDFINTMSDSTLREDDRSYAALAALQLTNYVITLAQSRGETNYASRLNGFRNDLLRDFSNFYGPYSGDGSGTAANPYVMDTDNNDDDDGTTLGRRQMNQSPRTLNEMNDKNVAAKTYQMFKRWDEMERMSTPPRDGSAPELQGLQNIPENHCILLHFSELKPNNEGGDRSTPPTPDQKRRLIPHITVVSTKNKFLTNGMFKDGIRAIHKFLESTPDYEQNPERLGTTRTEVVRQQYRFNVKFAFDASTYNNSIYSPGGTTNITTGTATGGTTSGGVATGGTTGGDGTNPPTAPRTPRTPGTNYVDASAPNLDIVQGIINSTTPASASTQRQLFSGAGSRGVPTPPRFSSPTGLVAPRPPSTAAAASMPMGRNGVRKCAFGRACDRTGCLLDHN